MNKQVNPGGIDMSPLMTRPEKVALVALGMSSRSFINTAMSNATMRSPFDEVWTVNRGFAGFRHDKLFVMDDLKWLEREKPDYAAWLKKHKMPIITSTVYGDYPTAIPYPILETIEFLEDDIHTVNTVSYAVAYAMYIGVKELCLYGCDFTYKNGITVEEGGLAVAYLLGRFKELGMRHTLPGETTMLYANKVIQRPDGSIGRPAYGYHRLTEMAKEDALDKQRKQRKKLNKKGSK
jgi:hypothetical protein